MSSVTRAMSMRTILFRLAALLVCVAILMILLLLTSGRSEAESATGNASLSGHTSSAARTGKAGSPDHMGGASPAMSRILPFAVITDNFNLMPGQTYSLIYSDTTRGSSAFAVVTFNGNPTVNTLRAWIDCGYNPLAGPGQWGNWCPDYANAQGAAPTQYLLGSEYPSKGPYYALGLNAGEGFNGWWLDMEDMGPDPSCPMLQYLVSRGEQDYVVPMADMEVIGGGLAYLHLRALYTFHIQNSYAVCNPPPGEGKSWYIEGVFLPR